MFRLDKERIGKIQKAILEELSDASRAGLAFLLSRRSIHVLLRNLRDASKAREKAFLLRSLRTLEKKRFLSLREKGSDCEVVLTEKGKRMTRIFALERLELNKKPVWDGKWHMMIFDIPERHGKARRAISYLASRIGALRLQYSVFVFPFYWRDEIDFLGEYFQVGKYIRYVVADEIEDDGSLKKWFSL